MNDERRTQNALPFRVAANRFWPRLEEERDTFIVHRSYFIVLF